MHILYVISLTDDVLYLFSLTIMRVCVLQNVNEGSLQFLQAHLDKLLNSKRVAPSTVTFYVRDVEKRENSVQGELMER